jgi:hypothetical protein
MAGCCQKGNELCRSITGLFWVITQQVVVISYGRFGTTYRPYLQGKNREEITTTRCVITQKIPVVIYFVTEA